MNLKKSLFILYFLLFFPLTSCGYHFYSQENPHFEKKTLTIPYIKGDRTGDLTAALIYSANVSGLFDYRNCNGQLTLCVEIIEIRDENIGFRYDRNQEEQLEKTLIPTEMRLCALAEVTLIDQACGSILMGPVRISAHVEFDHDYYLSQDGINVFSLGQLTDVDAAKEAAFTPLNRVLAQKIIDFISNAW